MLTKPHACAEKCFPSCNQMRSDAYEPPRLCRKIVPQLQPDKVWCLRTPTPAAAATAAVARAAVAAAGFTSCNVQKSSSNPRCLHIDFQLKKQKEKGSKYLIGNKISAVDIYWSTISMTILPASLEIMPKTKQNEGMLFFFEANSKIPEIKEVLSDRILSHRDYILKTYCETPAVLGGDLI